MEKVRAYLQFNGKSSSIVPENTSKIEPKNEHFFNKRIQFESRGSSVEASPVISNLLMKNNNKVLFF